MPIRSRSKASTRRVNPEAQPKPLVMKRSSGKARQKEQSLAQTLVAQYEEDIKARLEDMEAAMNGARERTRDAEADMKQSRDKNEKLWIQQQKDESDHKDDEMLESFRKTIVQFNDSEETVKELLESYGASLDQEMQKELKAAGDAM